MRLGFVYAGQGSQNVGMGKDFYEQYPLFRKTIDRAEELVKTETDFQLKKCCFEGPAEMLGSTRYTQPCMVAFAIGVTELLKKEHLEPAFTLGLSLGEYSALYAAGVLTQENVLPLVAFRGRVMEEAVTGRAVKMAAVLMMDAEVIEESCKEAEQFLQQETVQKNAGEKIIVEIANYNCPGQIVISGDAQAVDCACNILKEKGAKRIMPLAVSGPFHTSLMKPAGEKLKERLEQISFQKPSAEVIHNLTARPIQTGESYVNLLEKQVQCSVRLEDSLKYMVEQRLDAIIEIGPGNTISKFMKKISPETAVYSISTAESFRETITALAQKEATLK
jgi:[acyl-carrier-protein] S-malonyltransferase